MNSELLLLPEKEGGGYHVQSFMNDFLLCSLLDRNYTAGCTSLLLLNINSMIQSPNAPRIEKPIPAPLRRASFDSQMLVLPRHHERYSSISLRKFTVAVQVPVYIRVTWLEIHKLVLELALS